MAESSLQRAQSLLVAAYGKKDLPADEPTWRKLLRVLLGIPNTHPASGTLNELLTSSALATPREAAATSAGQLVELMQPIPVHRTRRNDVDLRHGRARERASK